MAKRTKKTEATKYACECWCKCSEGGNCSGEYVHDENAKDKVRVTVVCQNCWSNHLGWMHYYDIRNSREPHTDPTARLAVVVGAEQRGARVPMHTIHQVYAWRPTILCQPEMRYV